MTVEENKEKEVNPTEQPQPEAPDKEALAEAVADKPEEDKKPAKPQGKAKKPYMSNQYMVLPMKSYFWTMILFCIPVIGQLACLVMTLGGSRYRNKINFARACFVMMLLQAAILTGLYFLVQAVGSTLLEEIQRFLVSTGVGYPTDLTALDEWVKKLEEVPQVHQYLQGLNQKLLP